MTTAREIFVSFARHFDAVWGGCSRDGDLEFYAGKAAASGGPVLEIACGVGRVLGPILEQGISVYGVDSSPDMLAFARARLGAALSCAQNWKAGYTLAVQEQAMFKIPRKFPLIIMPWDSYLIPATEAARFCMLNLVFAHLLSGGIFALDVGNASAPAAESDGIGVSEWAASGDGGRIRELRRSIPHSEESTVEIETVYEIEKNVEKTVESMRYVRVALRYEEILSELAVAGFEVAKIFSDFRGGAFTSFNPRIVIIAKNPR
jgi:SAM-dependent methyltransferase